MSDVDIAAVEVIITESQSRSTEHDTHLHISSSNIITAKIEKQRAAARERMTARRTIATPEEREKQRTADRERMALKRATSLSEETTKRKAVAREAMQSKRAT